jgi:CelD/BcsL family acetyltransferase involved in cellulose biosynthesis
VEGHWGGVDLIERFASEWRQLCDEGPTDQPFYRPEWVGAYVRAFAPQLKLLLVTARIAGRLQAVLPLVEERRSAAGLTVRVLRSAANCHSCRFDLVRGPGMAGDAATGAVWQFLKACPHWDKLEFEYVPPEAALEQLVTAAALDGFPTEREASWRTPYAPLTDSDGSDSSWLERTDANFRANLRRRMRKLSSQGPLVLHQFAKADPAVLQRIYEVERSGWKGREGSAITCNPDTRQFYDEIAQEAARFGYLSLYLYTLNGRVVAAHFGLAHRGRYFLPKPAYDESYSQYSPGQLLMHAVLADCVRRGYCEFDFLGPLADWKEDWTSKVRPHSLWHVFHEGVWGRTIHAARFRTRRAVKALLGLAESGRWADSIATTC